MNKQKYMCNWHFVTECHDLNRSPGKVKKSKCSGVSYRDSVEGVCCEVANKVLREEETQ